MKKIYCLLLLLLLISSCKTIKIKDKDTTGKVLFKNLIKKSEKLEYAYITGLFKISGIDEVPSVFFKFESYCKFKENYVLFKISSLKTPIIDIIINQQDVILINHTANQYIKINVEQVDYSKLTGINFNPLDISYLFLGKIPYSKNMELINFELNNKNYFLKMSDATSEYKITLNTNEELTNVEIFNQYFDNIILKSIKYKNINENKIPSLLIFSTEDDSIQMNFIINKIDLNRFENIIDENIFNKYKKESSLNDIKIEIK